MNNQTVLTPTARAALVRWAVSPQPWVRLDARTEPAAAELAQGERPKDRFVDITTDSTGRRIVAVRDRGRAWLQARSATTPADASPTEARHWATFRRLIRADESRHPH